MRKFIKAIRVKSNRGNKGFIDYAIYKVNYTGKSYYILKNDNTNNVIKWCETMQELENFMNKKYIIIY